MAANIANLLTLVQRFCNRRGLPQPVAVIGNQDPDYLQILNLFEEELDQLSSDFPWQWLVNEVTFSALAVEDQGDINTIATNGFRYMVKESFWNRTQKLPIIGPLTEQDWQAIKAIIVTGPRYQFRYRGNHLLINPAPVVGHTYAFEYVSKNFVNQQNLGQTYLDYFSNDLDTVLMPDKLALAGLTWRWKKEKKLAYAEDLETYQMMKADAQTRDRAARQVNMAEDRGALVPGVWVPPGSWPLR